MRNLIELTKIWWYYVFLDWWRDIRRGPERHADPSHTKANRERKQRPAIAGTGPGEDRRR
jgi:hypothetical protein